MKILISAVLALFLIGCSSDTKQEEKAPKNEPVAKVEASEKAKVTEYAKAAQESVVVNDTATAKSEETKAEVVAVAEDVKAEVATKVEEAKATVSATSATTLYQVCAGCHGVDASKPALGKSQIIKGWDAKKISDALHGYKAGTYGGTMKSLMVGQVSKLSDDDIKALAEHISKL